MQQFTINVPSLSISVYTLKMVEEFMYFGLTVFINLSVDAEINKHFGLTILALVGLYKGVWENIELTMNIEISVYNNCEPRTLLYGGETWMPYAEKNTV